MPHRDPALGDPALGDPTTGAAPQPQARSQEGPVPGRAAGFRRTAPIAAVLASMSSVQLGAALSVPLFAVSGVVGTTWLRLTLASVVLLAVARPGRPARADLPAALLGLVMAGNAVAFSSATDRIPLGVAVAIEFCGPLTVAASGGRGGIGRLVIPATALAGVVLLTRPWTIGSVTGTRTWLGLGFAALAGLGWAGYIVLTAHVGRRREGFAGLAVALTVAAVALAPVGAVQSWPVLRDAALGSTPALRALAVCTVAALLVPLAAYALEMAALRRLDSSVFGVWMAFEPAIGALAGLWLLGQPVAATQVPGFALVVLAGVAAQRLGRR